MKSETVIIFNLLKSHKLRVTDCRLDTLRLFHSNNFALSQPFLEKDLGKDYDRVTIYRTLSSFMDAGLIHKVPDDTGLSKYALCYHEKTENHMHNDHHLHFKCEVCGNTQCIEGVELPEFSAPKGFVFNETTVLVQGICPECGDSKK